MQGGGLQVQARLFGSPLWRDGMDSGKMVTAYVEALNAADINFGKVLWHALRRNKEVPSGGSTLVLQIRIG
jgi:hypothetical protein